MTGDPDKEYGTNKPPPTRRVRERSKGDNACPSTSQNSSCQHPSWLSDACATRKDPELEWLAKDHPETNPITIKPETVSHAAEQFSWVPLPYCSPPGCPFPIKSLALSAHESPQTIHVRVLDKSPVSGPGRGPRSCNRSKEEGKKRDKKNEGGRKAEKEVGSSNMVTLQEVLPPWNWNLPNSPFSFLESLSLMHGSKVISTVVLGSLAENRKDYCLHCHVLRFGY